MLGMNVKPKQAEKPWDDHVKSYKLQPSNNISSDEIDEDDTADDTAGKKPIQSPASKNEQALKNVLDKMMDQ
ncbi:hypothetical protein Tco_1154586 [Tanacetum coccineum]